LETATTSNKGMSNKIEFGDRVEHQLNGELHRLDGPAIEWTDGDKEWWVNGQRHRVDGPAIEWANGDKMWFLNDKYHRVDGPAVEWTDGAKEWWVNGVRVDPPQTLRPEQQRHTDKECLVYHEIPTPGQKYRMCSFSEEHVFTLEGLTGFQRDRCLYCQHPLIEEVYIQE
jgi:hypothetical protein